MADKSNIYTIYASADEKLVFQLLHRLKSLEKRYNIIIWDNDSIHEGQVWKSSDGGRLAGTDLFILLLSKAFMYSEFVQQLEFKQVIDRYKAGASKIVPIILDDCPWDTNFESDDYNFSFKELHVLPEGGKPLENWGASEEALKIVMPKVEAAISAIAETVEEKKSPQERVKEISDSPLEDQLAMDFEKEVEAKRLLEEQRIRDVKVRKEAAENKLKQEAEAGRKVAEQQRLQREAEAAKKTEEEKRLKQEIEAQRIATEERLKKEAENQKRIEEEQRSDFEHDAIKNPIEDNRGELAEENRIPSKRIFIGLLIAAIGIAAILFFSKSGNDLKEETPTGVVSDTVVTQDSVGSTSSETIVSDDEDSTSKLAIGDSYDDGIVFEIAPSGKTGKIAHQEDAGPMPWQDAMIIHDQLGHGWRLPTLEELRTMYRTIGPGEDNIGEFADGLYWSATDYDEYQARLLRFRDGNTSYHYNKAVESRRFLVRAVRDFSR